MLMLLLSLIMDMIILNTILRVITRRYPIHISIKVRDGPMSDINGRSSEGGHAEIITLDLSEEVQIVRL